MILILKSNLYELIPSTLRVLRDRIALGVLPVQDAILIPEHASWIWRQLGKERERVFVVLQDGFLLEYEDELEEDEVAPALRKIRLHGCTLQEKAVNISGALQYGLELGFERVDGSHAKYLLASQDKKLTLRWVEVIREVIDNPSYSRPPLSGNGDKAKKSSAPLDVASTFLNINFYETFSVTNIAGANSNEGLELLLTLLDIVSLEHENEVLSAKYSMAVLTLLIQGAESEDLRQRLIRLGLVQRIIRLLGNVMTSVNTCVNVAQQDRMNLPSLLSICAQAVCMLLLPQFPSSKDAECVLGTRPTCKLIVNALALKCLAEDVAMMFVVRTVNHIMNDLKTRNIMLESGLIMAFSHLESGGNNGDRVNGGSIACPSTHMHDFVSQNFYKRATQLLHRDLASVCSFFTVQVLFELPAPVLILLLESDDDAVVLRSLQALAKIASSVSRPLVVKGICEGMSTIAALLRNNKTTSATVISTAVELVMFLTRHTALCATIRQGDVISSLTKVLENMDLHHNVHEMAAISIRTLLWNEPEAQEEFLIEADNGDCIFKLLKMLMHNYSSRAVEAIASVLENATASSNRNRTKIGECSGVWSICNAIAKQSEIHSEADPQATTALCRALMALVKNNPKNRERFLYNRSIYISLLHLLRSRRLSVVRAALTTVDHIFRSVDELRLLLHTRDVAVPTEPDVRKSVRKADKRTSTKSTGTGAVDVMALLVMHNKSQDYMVRRLARGLLNRIASSVDLLLELNLSLEHLMHLLRCTKLPRVLTSTLSVLTERFEMGSMPPLCANFPVKQATLLMQRGGEMVQVCVCVQHCVCPDAEYVFLYLYENRHTPRFKFILHGTRQQMPEMQIQEGPNDDGLSFVIVHAGPTSVAKVVLRASSQSEAQHWIRFLRIVNAGGLTATTLVAVDSGEDIPNAVHDARDVAGAQTVSVIKQKLPWKHLAAEATWSRLLSLVSPSHGALPPSVIHPLLHLFALLSARFDLPPIPEKSKMDKADLQKKEHIAGQLRALGGNNVLTRKLYQCFHVLNDMMRAHDHSSDPADNMRGLELTPMAVIPPRADGEVEDLPPGLVTHMSCNPPNTQQLAGALSRGFCAQVHLKHEHEAGDADDGASMEDHVLVSVNTQSLPLHCSIGHMHKLMSEIPNEGNLSVLRFVRPFTPRDDVARTCRQKLSRSVRHARSLAVQTLANLSEPSHPSHDSSRTAVLSGGRRSLEVIMRLIRVSGERIASNASAADVTHDQWRDTQADHCLLKHAFRLIRNLCSGTSQYQLYSTSPKRALAIDHSTSTSRLGRTRSRSDLKAVVKIQVSTVYSQHDTIQLFVQDVNFLKVALGALRNIARCSHNLFESALRHEITVVLQTLSHTTLAVRLDMVGAGVVECLCDLRADAVAGTDALWERQTRQMLDTFCGNDHLCQSLPVPQLVLLLNTQVNTVVYQAVAAVERMVHQLDFENIDLIIIQALESLKSVLGLCCGKAFTPATAAKIVRKLVSALYGIVLQNRYHEPLSTASVHLLLVKALTIPKLPEQTYMEAVSGIAGLVHENQELQQQLVDSSVSNSIPVLCQTIGMNAAICEKVANLVTQLATLQVFVESDHLSMVVKQLHALLQNPFGGMDAKMSEPAHEAVCGALDVIFKTSKWQNFLTFTELFPLLLHLLNVAHSSGLQANVCNLLRTTCDARDSKISVMRLSESGLTQIVGFSSDVSQARRAHSAQLLLRHWINDEHASVLSLLHVEELCLLARCGSLEVVQAVARQLANKISWGLHQPVKALLLPDKCGWLRRRSTNTWRKRWYVIKRPHLYEYHGNSGKDGEQLQRKLMLAGCTIEKIVIKKSKAIQIAIPNYKERLILTTNDNGETLNNWTKCLMEHISYANIDTGHVAQAAVNEENQKNQTKRTSLKRGLLGPRGVMLLNIDEGETLTWSDFVATERISLVLGLVQSESPDVALQASRIASLLLPHALTHDKSQVPKLAKHCAHGVMRFLERAVGSLSRSDRRACLQILAQCRDQIETSFLTVSDASGEDFNVLYPVATFSRVTAMPLDLSRNCMRCDTPFSRALPAQNCASCGIVVCSFCNNSPVWAIVKHSMAKVCNHCYEQSKNIRLPLVEDYRKCRFAQMMALGSSAPALVETPPMQPEEKHEEQEDAYMHALPPESPAETGDDPPAAEEEDLLSI